MAFNLQKVLKALLFSSSQPLSTKDIQTAFARFHEQATFPTMVDDEGAPAAEGTLADGAAENAPTDATPTESVPPAEDVAPTDGSAPVTSPSPEATEVPVASPTETDAELYQDVPSLITATQIREAMNAIGEELKAANDIYLLVEGPNGFRIVTHPRFARWIRIMRDEPPPVKLTQSALETLAIVAYRQPVTRTEIETIRGVSAEAGLNKLMERELVYIVGRADLPGRPLQYGTTDKFLDFVGVKSLVELPASDVLSPRQIDEWLKNAINARPPTDAEMGLPLEEGEGPSPNREAVEVEHGGGPEAPAPEAAPEPAAPAEPTSEQVSSSEQTPSA